MNIKCKLSGELEFDIFPDLTVWKKSSKESRKEYVEENLKEHILENIEELFSELLITYKIKI